MKLYLLTLIALLQCLKFLATYQIYDPRQAQEFFQYSRIAYCQPNQIKHWICPNCLSIKGISSAFIAQDEKYKSQAYVVCNERQKLIVIAFRGTQNVINWRQNLKILVKKQVYCKNCQVHSGFFEIWKSISQEIIEKVKVLKDKNPEYEILVTGHSLGGSLANFAALELTEQLNIKVDYIITFGQPRVGNQDFQEYFSQKIPNLYRITHLRDPVPLLPLKSQNFRHSSQEIYYHDKRDKSIYKVCSDFNGEDESCINQNSALRQNIADHLRYQQYTGCGKYEPKKEDYSDLNEYFTKIIINNLQEKIKKYIDL